MSHPILDRLDRRSAVLERSRIATGAWLGLSAVSVSFVKQARTVPIAKARASSVSALMHEGGWKYRTLGRTLGTDLQMHGTSKDAQAPIETTAAWITFPTASAEP